MATSVGLPTQVVSAPATTSSSSSSTTTSSNATLASNFQTFLTLLTTQLQNQNPMDPLDTNQFTQQLVQFAQVEQQLKQNDQLASLIAIQKTTQATQALNFVGSKVVVDGTTSALDNSIANWSLTSPKDVSATVNIMNKTGQTVYTGSFSMNTGMQTFQWDGRDAQGVQWPDGNYTISVTGKDTSGQTVAIPSEIEGVVDSVDLTKNPVELKVGGQPFTIDKIKRVVRPQTSST